MLEGFKKKITEILGNEKDMFEGLGKEAKALVDELRPIIDSLPETDYGKYTLERVIEYYRSNGTQKKNELSVLLHKEYGKDKKLNLEQITDRVNGVIEKIQRLHDLVNSAKR